MKNLNTKMYSKNNAIRELERKMFCENEKIGGKYGNTRDFAK